MNGEPTGQNASPPITGQIVSSPKHAFMASLKSLLEKARPSMDAVVPKHVTPDRLIKVALVAVSRTPALLECSAISIVESVMVAAQLGLDCGGVLGSAYLVPYKGKAQLIIGYRGMIDLARRSGEIDTIEAHIVRRNDTFELEYGLQPILRHVPMIDGDAGDMRLVYAIARLKDGGRQVEVMSKAEVDRIRQRSKAANSGPWVSDYDEMARKTVVRRLAKYLPLTTELAEALVRDADKLAPGTGLDAIDVMEDEDDTPAAPTNLEELAKQLQPAPTPAPTTPAPAPEKVERKR